MSSAPLLEARGVSKEFVLADGLVRRMRGRPAETLKAVDDVSLTIERGETVGLVGESGCGKSTFGRLLLRLYEPTAGQIFHDGIDILGHDARATRELRTKIQVVFALDVSVQAQVLNLMMHLQEDLGLTYLFLAHNLGVVQHISQRVAVMYLGKIVELAFQSTLVGNPGMVEPPELDRDLQRQPVLALPRLPA